jgi:Mpv17 / PMP22 family
MHCMRMMKSLLYVTSLLLTLVSRANAFAIHPTKFSSSLTRTKRSMMLLPDHVELLCSTYTYCLEEYHLPTQSITAGLFSAMGDILAQSLEKDKAYDARRTYNFLLKGLGGGIMWSYWFQISDPISLQITESIYKGSNMEMEHAIRVAVCIMLEQCLVSPVFYSLWDIPVPALLSGSPVRQLPAQVANKLGPMLIANAKVWTPANLITYNLAPEFRVLFASCTDLVWQAICSQITSAEIVIQGGAKTVVVADSEAQQQVTAAVVTSQSSLERGLM